MAFDLRLSGHTYSDREGQMRKADVHCSFCDLIHGAGEASICYEDSDALAFMDIQPVNAGHVLVVPRQHHESLVDTPPELAMHLFQVATQLANVIRKVTNCDDMNIVVNSGKTAGQDVFHYHVHLIPRRDGDGFDIPLPLAALRCRTVPYSTRWPYVSSLHCATPFAAAGMVTTGSMRRASTYR